MPDALIVGATGMVGRAVMRGQTLDLAPSQNGDGRGTEMPDHRASDHPGRADEKDGRR